MLTELHVKNLALIDETDVEFGNGLNILTGETGAGKSVLLGSVNLALGQKMSKTMLRNGEDSCLVELTFQTDSRDVMRRLQEMDVETDGGQLVITRKYRDGRSTFRLNGETCTAGRIRDISAFLLDIHGQHEHQKLLYPEYQLRLLDDYGRDKIAPLAAKVSEDYAEYSGVLEKLGNYQMDDAQKEREISFLKYEINEIETAALSEGEEEELEKQYRIMANSRKIAESLGTVQQLVDSDDGAGDRIGRAVRELSSAAGYDDRLGGMLDTLSDIDSLVNDFNRSVSDYLADFSFSEEDFYRTEQRLDLINSLKAKYGNTVAAIMEYLEKQKKRLEEIENLDEMRERLSSRLEEIGKVLGKDSEALSEARKEAAASFSEEVREGLSDLNFLSNEFEIRFTRNGRYGKNGFDSVEYMISTNPGEPVRSLAEVASGGELSRIMLAIKTVMADRDDTETLIFDEIDAGISGRTAQKVAEKMAEIGRHHQVICITHLAQIAAMADHHFLISKDAGDKGTTSHIRELNAEESVTELARILGGAEITDAVMNNALEMKQLAEERKRSAT